MDQYNDIDHLNCSDDAVIQTVGSDYSLRPIQELTQSQFLFWKSHRSHLQFQ